MKYVKWKGKRFLLVGSLKRGGAIATVRQYKNGLDSTAHLFESGEIYQHGQLVGKRADLRIIGPADVVPSRRGMARILFGVDI